MVPCADYAHCYSRNCPTLPRPMLSRARAHAALLCEVDQHIQLSCNSATHGIQSRLCRDKTCRQIAERKHPLDLVCDVT